MVSYRNLLLLILLLLSSGCQKGESANYKRVIFVTIDTLRADRLSAFGYPRETAPFLSSKISEGTLFTNAFSAAPHTAPSHTTMFTGLFPFEHQVLKNHDILGTEIYDLAEYARGAGYQVLGVSAVGFMNGKVGFPSLSETIGKDRSVISKKTWYRNAKEVVNIAIHWLENSSPNDNQFIWLHFYDVHQWKGRANVPPEYVTELERTADDRLVEYLKQDLNTPLDFFGSTEKLLHANNGYDARIKFVDAELKRFSDYLSQRGLLSSSLWVITSDHGEGLGNHNYEGHGEFLYQEQLHVPLVFWSSDRKVKAQKIDQLSRTVDLFPTLAQLIGVPLDRAHQISGISLAQSILGSGSAEFPHYSFAERRPKDMVSFRKTWEEGEIYSLHSLDGKFIEHSHGTDEFYDFKNDRFELENRYGKGGELEQTLRSEGAKLYKPKHSTSSDSEQALPPEEVEELKTLGYL